MSVDFDSLYNNTDNEVVVNLNQPDTNTTKTESETPDTTPSVELIGPIAKVVSETLDKIYAYKEESMMQNLASNRQHTLASMNDGIKDDTAYVYVTSNKLLRDVSALVNDFDAINEKKDVIGTVLIETEANEVVNTNAGMFDAHVRSLGKNVVYSREALYSTIYK